jgi:hypothetical protein
MKNMAYRLLLLAALSAIALPVSAERPMSKIRIEVKDLQDKPVDRASVIVKFMDGRSVMKLGKGNVKTWELKTNQEGVAKLPAIPQGKIQVQVIAKKYQTFGDVFDINEEEKTIPVKLNPPQQQYSAHE